jgi:hypothetical protein
MTGLSVKYLTKSATGGGKGEECCCTYLAAGSILRAVGSSDDNAPFGS